MKKTTLRTLLLALLTTTLGWSQPVGSVIISGTVIDSASGNPLPNWEVYMADTSSYAAGMSMLTYTDINGNFSDTLDLYDSVGVVFAYADNNCNNTGASNVFVQSYSFGPNLPSTVSYTASFITCSTNSGGGGSGGGGSGGGTGQLVGSAIISGTVIDSASGNPLANWPVYITESVSAAAGLGMISVTDANGNYLDTLHLYDSSGVVIVFSDDTCSPSAITQPFFYNYSFGANSPSTFSLTASFNTCWYTGGGGGGSGGGGVNCKAEFEIDTSLTGSGQIVLYNTSKVNSNSVLNSPFVMYEWFWGNGASSLGSLPSYQYTTSGPIDICLEQSVFDSQGNLLCSDLFCDSLYIDTAGNVSFKGVNVSVNVFAPGQMSTLEETQVDFEVFPNPTSNIVNIEPLMEGSFQLFNELGQMLDEGAIQSTYDLTNYESGVYILLLQTAKESRHIKLIKQ